MGFFRQEYWSGLPFPPPGHLPDPGITPEFPVSPALQADSLSFHQGNTEFTPSYIETLWKRFSFLLFFSPLFVSSMSSRRVKHTSDWLLPHNANKTTFIKVTSNFYTKSSFQFLDLDIDPSWFINRIGLNWSPILAWRAVFTWLLSWLSAYLAAPPLCPLLIHHHLDLLMFMCTRLSTITLISLMISSCLMTFRHDLYDDDFPICITSSDFSCTLD